MEGALPPAALTAALHRETGSSHYLPVTDSNYSARETALKTPRQLMIYLVWRAPLGATTVVVRVAVDNVWGFWILTVSWSPATSGQPPF
jgi:hypothetical protein